MRRPLHLLVAAVLVIALVPTSWPTSGAATGVRHYLAADQVGTAGDDAALDVTAVDHLVVSAGVVQGSLPGLPPGGGEDAFVRAVAPDLDEIWTRQIGGPGADRATAVASDGERVVAGGTTEGGLVVPSLGGQAG